MKKGMKMDQRIERIKERQKLLHKWINDYENCTYDEQDEASECFDDLVDDVDYLLGVINSLRAFRNTEPSYKSPQGTSYKEPITGPV